MTEWKSCQNCGEIALALFRIEYHSQHCSPSLHYLRIICDQCLENVGIDPDTLVKAISSDEE